MSNYGLKNSNFTVCTTAITGTQDTDIDGTPVDMQGYEGVMFMVPIIATSATSDTLMGIVGAESASSGGTFLDYTTATGQIKFLSTAANLGDDTLVILDIHKPKDRWVRPTLISSSEMMHGSCIAVRYGTREGPTVFSTATDGVSASAVFATPSTG